MPRKKVEKEETKKNVLKVGSMVVTTKEHRCFVKTLPAGSRVEITKIDEQGKFWIKDETGFEIIDVREI